MRTDGGARFARAIITTDTHPKSAGAEVELGGRTVRIGGSAKGAGMIHPNMATLLAFVTTDAAVDPEFLQTALARAGGDSFNMITVDGDTSTNDTLVVLANGAAGNPVVNGGEDGEKFTAALTYVCGELAKAIVSDGEGATRLIRVDVRGAASDEDARDGGPVGGPVAAGQVGGVRQRPELGPRALRHRLLRRPGRSDGGRPVRRRRPAREGWRAGARAAARRPNQ